MLETDLRQMGFGEKKAVLYKALLTMGRGTAAELAAGPGRRFCHRG